MRLTEFFRGQNVLGFGTYSNIRTNSVWKQQIRVRTQHHHDAYRQLYASYEGVPAATGPHHTLDLWGGASIACRPCVFRLIGNVTGTRTRKTLVS